MAAYNCYSGFASKYMNVKPVKKARDENKFWGSCCDHEKLNQELLKINDTLM